MKEEETRTKRNGREEERGIYIGEGRVEMEEVGDEEEKELIGKVETEKEEERKEERIGREMWRMKRRVHGI